MQWDIAVVLSRSRAGCGFTNVTRYAELVKLMSDGRMELTVYGAGELVPPFEVEGRGTGRHCSCRPHATLLRRPARKPRCTWFTGVPFGMTSSEHFAWLKWGGGQELFDDVYAERNLKPFYSGNSNTQSGGWFKQRLESVEDLDGLNMRIAGLGADAECGKLGVNAVLMPPGEIFQALQSGAIDAAEWVGPMLDQAFGLQRVTNLCYMPAYAEPGAAVAVVFNRGRLRRVALMISRRSARWLPRRPALEMHAQFDYFNAQAARQLEEAGVEFLPWPEDITVAMREAWNEVREELRAEHTNVARVLESYEPYLDQARNYSGLMTEPMLAGRGAEVEGLKTRTAPDHPGPFLIPGRLLPPYLGGLAHRLRRRPFQDRLARGAGLVETPAGCVEGRLCKAFALAALCRLGEIAHGGDEQIERGFRFRFGGLDQHGAVRHEGEIHRHRMIALVDHRLGEIRGVETPVSLSQLSSNRASCMQGLSPKGWLIRSRRPARM